MSAINRSTCADVLAGLKHGALLGIALAVLVLPPAGVASFATSATPGQTHASGASMVSQPARRADFGGLLLPSAEARHVADWVAESLDNQRLPFAILDKRGARIYVFDANAGLIGSSLVLLGSAVGDESVAGIGDRPLSQVRPHERTTAAGRFVSEPGHDETGDKVVWVDYDSALAMHRVKVIDPKERRFERIATDSIDDKRISNGCINVPVSFFDSVVEPALGRSRAVVYVLPEIKPLQQVFQGAYRLATR
ncbi:MAG: hypothetical protein ABI887_06375 [Burkholderiales bacterium]